MATSSYVGIDVSKDGLDVVALEKKQVSNTEDGIQLAKQMVKPQPELTMELPQGRGLRDTQVHKRKTT